MLKNFKPPTIESFLSMIPFIIIFIIILLHSLQKGKCHKMMKKIICYISLKA